MADADHVQVTLKVQNVGITRANFGTALILSHLVTWPERSRTYDSLAAALDDVDADSPEGLAVAALFAQSPAPTKVKIGRAGGTAPTQRFQLNVAAVTLGRKYEVVAEGHGVTKTTVSYTTKADLDFVDGDVDDATDEITEVDHGMATGDGPYRVSNAGGALPTGLAADTNYWIIAVDEDTYKLASSKANALAGTDVDITAAAGGGTHTLRRNQNDVIIAQLEQGLNAVVGKNFTAAQQAGAGETDHLLVTGNAAGAWFSIEVSDAGSLANKLTHADPGIATELAAILDEDSDWYHLHTLYNSQAYVLAAAAWVEANKKFYSVDVPETESITTAYTPAVSTDTLAELCDLAYVRVHGAYYPSPARMFSAALEGRLSPLNPGAWTAKFKTLSGISPVVLSSTQRTNIVARRANSYMLEMGRAITFEGTVFSPVYGFADVVVGLDAFLDDLRKGQFGIMVALDKVAYTDEDIAMLAAEAIASAARYSSDERPVLRRDPAPTITFPKVADIAPATRATRVLPDGRLKAELAGAVHKVLLDIVITP